ncbi:DNA helicase, partial [Tanacetum coccineum]
MFGLIIGTDRVIANVTKPVADIPSTSNTPSIQIDEIKNCVEARSFAEIRTLNGITYLTNKAACQAFGLLDPMNLWQRLGKDMSDEIPCMLSKSLRIPKIERNEKKMKVTILFDLEAMLISYSKSLKDFGLPPPPEDMIPILQNRFLMEETNYNMEHLLKERNLLIPRLNEDQTLIFDEITRAVKADVQKLIFVYKKGGTGKIFLWKAITSTLRLEEKIILAVGSFGIASLHLADLLRHTNLIISDEAPMNDRRCFEALDRCLGDILDSPDILFGGQSIMLGDYFRQTLPMKKASKLEIIDASITRSYLWEGFKTYTLKKNMRLQQSGMTEEKKAHIKDFSTWLLNIGDGTIGTVDSTDTQYTFSVDIPNELCILDSATALTELINFIYDDNTFQTPTVSDLQKKVIVCSKNESADMLNARVLTLLNTELHVYLSSHEAIPHGNDGGEIELLYPTEYLNSLKLAGLLPHRLEQTVGTPIILLRNLNITGGLCNGTRMIVTQLLSKDIEARIITGTRTSAKVFLPRIPLTNRDLQLPFIFKRKQFPVKLCYVMTISKSQGQSLERIGVFLLEPVFAHRQLYVALSRATSSEGLKILIKHQTNETGNMTKNIVYRDFLAAVAIAQKPVIIAVSSAWANKRYGVLQLSSTSATHFYLNPNIPEVHYILSVYANFINPTPALEIQREACSSQIDEQMRNCHTIESLLSVNPQHYEQINFTTQAALLEVTAPNGWYYRKCNACNIKVSENSDISLCPNHGPQPTPNYG